LSNYRCDAGLHTRNNGGSPSCPFILAQFAGAFVATFLFRWLRAVLIRCGAVAFVSPLRSETNAKTYDFPI